MRSSQAFFALSMLFSLALLGVGCGSQKIETQVAAKHDFKSQLSSLNSDEILQLNEENFKVTEQEDGILAFEYSEAAIPALDLAKIKAIRINSPQLSEVQFNQQEQHVDGFIQEVEKESSRVELINGHLVLEEGSVALKLDGAKVKKIQEYQGNFINNDNPENKSFNHGIRILLTDKSQPGRPIKARIVFPL